MDCMGQEEETHVLPQKIQKTQGKKLEEGRLSMSHYSQNYYLVQISHNRVSVGHLRILWRYLIKCQRPGYYLL